VEGDPTTGQTIGPDTMCSCWYPFQYNPECCERPDCIVQGSRQLPCSGTSGALCAPCADDSACASGLCARMLRVVNDVNGMQFTTAEQFCTQFCNVDADCGGGYTCVMMSGSPIKACVPSDGSCWR
jgi:hypothetical protein